VADVCALNDEFVARGAKVRFPPTIFEWAFEMQVEDLDGNVLRLASDSKKEMPYGPFLDPSGVLWEETEDGGYRALNVDRDGEKTIDAQP
jgi:hypothetical protein